ncbi:acetyl/propionyl/methylcrotonyl-CoA carboxylase subunit alpha [Streptomyces sp. CRN 30]|uniref:acetyl/propionyl/methylcrotonyl-CoA carboxylase subunit alpha n=1 Tax=Streptomyces sp. CRN 30 TaxID=3075613 RepID=UPI002A7EFC85|nr:biotin carboxylase N-terminal domain-containing protein [Streptomyces sp. CRN 30]
MRKVLIANRGEIAVRVVRACRDAGLASVAVYADQDRDAPHARLADEAFALRGGTAAETYLDVAKLLATAAESGADAVHPGYGFLSEDAGFARAVLAAGLTWIGPPPEAIERLGDKVAAREIARRVDAPLAPGTDRPVEGPEEVLEFARLHGLPLAVKAVGGGGGRGLKVARTLEEIPELLESASREAAAAFGRGDCFVEKYLDRARHIETQCLADRHGTVVVVSTRDCSVQRRHQKLIEEAPAPFLTPEQEETLRSASRAILAEAGYVGAGTCEFLLGEDGTLSFLEVNTRLQVEHPVTEEITGIDLVLEQFRIADGEALRCSDPVPRRGHSIEFRVNGEDVGRGFLPTPGTVTRWSPPAGPGVRVDTGMVEGTVVDGAFDSMLAKLVVTGADRRQALARARRALEEFTVEGVPTTLPLARALLDVPEFTAEEPGTGFAVHTRWLETDCPVRIEPWEGGDAGDGPAVPDRLSYTVEVGGRRLEVALPQALAAVGPAVAGPGGSAPRRRPRASSSAARPDGNALSSPMVGTVVKVAAVEGSDVAEGDVLFVIEAMKMEQQIKAHRAGVVHAVGVSVGASVSRGAALCEIRAAA